MPRKTKEQIEKESITNIQKDTKNDTVKTLSTTENAPKKTDKKSSVTKQASKTSRKKTNAEKSKTTTAKVSKESSSTKNTIAKTSKSAKNLKNTDENENIEIENSVENMVENTKKSTLKNKVANSKKSTSKSKVADDTENTSKNSKASSKKSTSKNKVADDTKSTRKSSKSSSKKTASKSKTDNKTKKSNRKSTKSNNLNTSPTINEYYDLPYRYNQTVVKVLAQTPNNLFIYWDISDEDRENLKKQYGENFFEITKPILIVYNETLGYSFEVEINDFANSWYLHVNDSKSNYKIELGRKPINQEEFKSSIHKNNIQNHLASDENTTFIHITTSNNIEAPNDRILFNKNQKMVYYKNVKTNQEFSKNISSLSFMHNIGKIYDIYDLYKEIYNKENIEDLYNLDNPSSHSSSTFK